MNTKGDIIHSDRQRSPTLPSSSVMAAKRLFKLPADDDAFTTPALSVAERHRLGRGGYKLHIIFFRVSTTFYVSWVIYQPASG